MHSLDKFRKNIFIKAVVVPILITTIMVITFLVSIPSIIDSLPNAQEYSQQSVDEGGQGVG